MVAVGLGELNVKSLFVALLFEVTLISLHEIKGAVLSHMALFSNPH